MDAVSDIKSKINLEDVVADYLELKPAGSNLKALSPFTQERTPSFMVSPEKQIWHDFSSNKGGDMFTFIEEVEGVEFKDALEILARKAGVDLSDYGKKKGMPRDQRERLEAATLEAARFYQQQLLSHKPARDYVVEKRGFKRGAIEDFYIGYAPKSGQALTRHLLDKKFNEKELTGAGLAVNRRGKLLDMFRDRVLVALADRQGKVIGFTGRLLSDDANGPKYINTAQTQLYDKSKHVFGLHLAKQAIRDEDLAILVEGNLDVVSAHQAGSKNVVATAGTAMTQQQIRQLKHLSKNLSFAFDSDAAGLRATLRAIPIAQAEGMKLSIISLPEGKDPDDIITQSPDTWKKLVEKRQYAVDWVLDYYEQQFDLSTASGKSDFVNVTTQILRSMEDAVEQDHYIKEVAKRARTTDSIVKELVEDGGSDKPKRRKAVKIAPQPAAPQAAVIADSLLGLTLLHPGSRFALSQLETDFFKDHVRSEVLRVLRASKQNINQLLEEDLKEHQDFVKILQLIGEEQFGTWNEADASVEADQLALRLRKAKTEHEKHKLSQAIANAEAQGDLDLAQELISQWQALNKGGTPHGQEDQRQEENQEDSKQEGR